MSVKIRLQRKGRRKKPYYHIVVADARAPRDGRYIERLGSYDPGTVPATINLDVEKSVVWLANGAQPSDTVRSILSFKGAMYKHHLNKGVAKGALTTEQAAEKFDAWMKEKEARILTQVEKDASKKAKALNELFKLETKKKEEIAAKIIEKNTPPPEEPSEEVANDDAEASTEEGAVVETATEEVVEEAPVVEETPVAEADAPAKEEDTKET